MSLLDQWFVGARSGASELHISRKGALPTILRWIGLQQAFGETGTPFSALLLATATLNFAAPGAVPGSVDLTVTVPGAALGDLVTVAAPAAVGANYLLTGFVSAVDTVTVRWTQIAGAAADPDAAGGTYRVSVLKQ